MTDSIYTNLTDEQLLELFDERAAMREYGNDGMERKDAEALAYKDLRELVGNVPIPAEIRDIVRKKF